MSDYALSQNGTVTIETLPSWKTFFDKYVTGAEASVGSIMTLGTRLIPAANFETEEGMRAIYEMLLSFLPVASPNIILGTPFLYKHTESSTSVTPAWRNSIWHVSIFQLPLRMDLHPRMSLYSLPCMMPGISTQPLHRKLWLTRISAISFNLCGISRPTRELISTRAIFMNPTIHIPSGATTIPACFQLRKNTIPMVFWTVGNVLDGRVQMILGSRVILKTSRCGSHIGISLIW